MPVTDLDDGAYDHGHDGPYRSVSPAAILRDRFGALRDLSRLLRLVWRASTNLTLATVALRLTRAVLPATALYVGKLIIDVVVSEARLPHPGPGLADWLAAAA